MSSRVVILQNAWEIRRAKRMEAIRAVKRHNTYFMWQHVAAAGRRALTPDPTARIRKRPWEQGVQAWRDQHDKDLVASDRWQAIAYAWLR